VRAIIAESVDELRRKWRGVVVLRAEPTGQPQLPPFGIDWRLSFGHCSVQVELLQETEHEATMQTTSQVEPFEQETEPDAPLSVSVHEAPLVHEALPESRRVKLQVERSQLTLPLLAVESVQ
jgi:hypothetical protein